MSPHLIIILMLSSSSLLILLLFAIRKRSKKSASLFESKPKSNLPDLSQLNLSELENLTPKMTPISIPVREIKEKQSSSDLVELINRYGFFQGKNLERFTSFAQENNWGKIELLIAEKYKAQKKENAEFEAEKTVKKLMLVIQNETT